MSVSYGFYNAVVTDGVPDRSYNAEDISRLFDGVINDGIFALDEELIVSAAVGMHVSVGSGRAWFNHTWTLNDSLLTLPVEPASTESNRIDTVVLEVNENTRTNSIRVLTGSTSRPELNPDPGVYWYALADVSIPRNAETVTVTNRRGTPDGAPFVTPVTESFTVEDLIATMTSDWQSYFTSKQSDWNDQATAAINQVTSETQSYIDTFEDNLDAWMDTMQQAIVPTEEDTYTRLYNLIYSNVSTNAVLYAESWADDEYTIYSDKITATSNQEIMERFDPAETTSAINAKHSAWNAADIIPLAQYPEDENDLDHPNQGRVVLKALGIVPNVDIPITIIFRGIK